MVLEQPDDEGGDQGEIGPRKVSTREQSMAKLDRNPEETGCNRPLTCGTARTTVKGTGSPRPGVRYNPTQEPKPSYNGAREGPRSSVHSPRTGQPQGRPRNPRQPQSHGTGNKCTTLTAEQCGRENLTPIGTRLRPKCKTNPRLTENLEERTNQPSMEEEHRK